MKKLMKRIASLMLAFASVITMVAATGTKAEAATPTVWYCSHVQDYGWMSTVTNGTTSGTTGQSRRVEAMMIDLSGVSGGVTYRAHSQNYGWMGWVTNKQVAGTTGKGLRMEAIQIKLTGQAAYQYNIQYRVHVQNYGWMSWVQNGATAGTTGQGLRVEAIQIKLTAKSSGTTTTTATATSTSTGAASSSVLGNARVQEFINSDNWKVGTLFDNSVSAKTAGNVNMGWGCNGYARDFAKYVYGKAVTDGSKYTDISEIRAGDILYVTPKHWMVVLARSGNTLDIIHGNWTNGKVCRNSFTINTSTNAITGSGKTFSYGYHY